MAEGDATMARMLRNLELTQDWEGPRQANGLPDLSQTPAFGRQGFEAFAKEHGPGVAIDAASMATGPIGRGMSAVAGAMRSAPKLSAALLGALGLGAGTGEAEDATLTKRQAEAEQVLAHGLVPIIEPEVNIKSPERDAADRILLDEILKNLDAMPEGRQVMLKLSIPAEAGLFLPLVGHPKVLRVVALSGGFSREEACRELAKNPGMIASFSRALLSDLRHQQSDEEFNRTLGTAIDEIYEASVSRIPA
jgi:fructose-bisphosphate aldolase class I